MLQAVQSKPTKESGRAKPHDAMKTPMRDKLVKLISSAVMRRLAAAAAFAAAVALSQPAFAQKVVVIVNGSPITTYDIEQRTKFNTLATHKTPARQDVIEELIDEKLKVQVGQRYKLEVTDAEVDTAYAAMGQRMRFTPQQLTQALAQGGVDALTLKSRIRADIAWQQIVRGKFQSALQIREKGRGRQARKQQEGRQERGRLRIQPAPDPVRGAERLARGGGGIRKRDAEALRTRFQGCDTGLAFARALRDVAVREQIVKSSADLAPALRKILDDTAVGKLTNPEGHRAGDRDVRAVRQEGKPARWRSQEEVRDEMFAEQFQAKSQAFSQDFCATAP